MSALAGRVPERRAARIARLLGYARARLAVVRTELAVESADPVSTLPGAAALRGRVDAALAEVERLQRAVRDAAAPAPLAFSPPSAPHAELVEDVRFWLPDTVEARRG